MAASSYQKANVMNLFHYFFIPFNKQLTTFDWMKNSRIEMIIFHQMSKSICWSRAINKAYDWQIKFTIYKHNEVTSNYYCCRCYHRHKILNICIYHYNAFCSQISLYIQRVDVCKTLQEWVDHFLVPIQNL